MILREAATIIILVSLIAGIAAHHFSKKNDSCMEQFAEDILHTQGIDIDFSAADKAEEAPKVPK